MSARLDGRGYHLTPIRKRQCKASFIGTPEAVIEEGVRYEEASTIQVRFGNSETVNFTIGDHVFLTGEHKGSACEIGTILKFWEQIEPKPHPGDAGIWFSCNWFWRPETLELDDDLDPAWKVRIAPCC